MIKRLLYGWNLHRILYLVMGIIFVTFFIQEKQYLGAIAGVLFSGMALFNFGCAAGNCSPAVTIRKRNYSSADTKYDAEYKEIK